MRRLPVLVLLAAFVCAAAYGAARPQPAAALGFVDQQVKQNVLLLRGYIDTQAAKAGFLYPTRAQVRKGGGLSAPVWPMNPWTGKPMAPGSGRGTYTYTPAADRHSYTLVAHFSKGNFKVTGESPGWLATERAKAASDLAAAQSQLTTAQADLASARADAVRSGVAVLDQYVMALARLNGGLPPAAGFGDDYEDMFGYWPADPYAGQPMEQGTAPGQFTYEPHGDGSYSLTGHLSGDEYVISRPAYDWAALKNYLTIEGVTFISYGLEIAAIQYNDVYPPTLTKDSLQTIDPWPKNPMTNAFMTNNLSAGDYRYSLTAGGTSYDLVANLVGGDTYDVGAWTRPLFEPLWRLRVSLKDLCAQGYAQVLKDYIDEWRLEHGGALPQVDDVTSAGAVGQAHTWWPVNPWTNSTMTPGTYVGQYEYLPSGDGSYALILHQSPLPMVHGDPATEYPPTYTAQ
jgi:hypothetical protein